MLFISIIDMASYTLYLNIHIPVDETGKPIKGIPVWLVIIKFILLSYILGRISLILPAAAIGESCSLKKSWKLTHNNGLEMLVIFSVLPLVITQIDDALIEEDVSVIENTVIAILSYALYSIVIFALSIAYRELKYQEIS